MRATRAYLDTLRAFGLTVVEVNGCWTRGTDTLDPDGSVNHHTAGAAFGDAPSLGYVVRNVLCNALQSRQRDRNGLDVIYFVAAGKANHAGVGAWRGVSGNSHFVGLEVEHVGSSAEPFPSSRRETSARFHAATARHFRFAPGMVCQHHEYAQPAGRKSDFARVLLDPTAFRNRVATILAPPTQEDDVYEYRIVSVPEPEKIDGGGWRQIVGHDVAGKLLGPFSYDVTATIKANDNGAPVPGQVQVCSYAGNLVLSFIGADGEPMPAGNVGVVLGHPER